ncbi:hypothetical protein TPA0906_73370 [Streptomyces olivaceus]|nr:hypothetical protein TPA0906_73370 [Streptomyces olivaceus]
MGGDVPEAGGEELRLAVLQPVQFMGDPLAALVRVRIVQYRPVGVTDAVVVVVQVVECAEFEVDRVLLGVPVLRDAVLVRGLSGDRYGGRAGVGGGQRWLPVAVVRVPFCRLPVVRNAAHQ